VLKRLDKQAEEDRAETSLSARIADDWMAALDAVRAGGTGAIRQALEPKADKADTPPSPPGCDPSENVWQNDDGVWMTTFPPPPGFDGYASGTWDGLDYYERACTPEETELLDGHQAAAEAEEQAKLTADAEAERDQWFARLRTDLTFAPLPDREG
jgi:hypothetical protein